MKSHYIAGIVIFLIFFNAFVPMLIDFFGANVFDYINILLFTNFIALLYIILPNKILLE